MSEEVEEQANSTNTGYSSPITRRRLLQGTAAAGVLGAFVGPTSARRPTGRHIIGTKPAAASANAVRRRADAVHRELDFGDIGRAVAGRFSDQALAALEQRSDVRYIEEEGTYEAIAQTLPWGVDRVDAEQIHAENRTGEGAHIAIIDTGIDASHEDLEANLGEGYAPVNCSGSDCEEPWDDDHDHGTHVAGTAGAVDNDLGVVGVSTEATLHAVKVLNEFGSGAWADLADGIQWVADQGYDVINMSLGGSAYSHLVADACLYAWDNGVLLIAAAGNNYQAEDSVGYPAKLSTVVAVSATNEDDELAEFSSKGPEVELTAPGANVYSTLPDDSYGSFGGTSMASPHVAGAGGQLRALEFTNRTARNQLREAAENIGLPDNEQGWGLLDLEGAVPEPVGEVGVVSTNQSDRDTWHTVNLQQSYDQLAVVMDPVSFNGPHPCHIRLRNVSGSSFEFRIEEWAYRDGAHTSETISYVAMERGAHTLPDGSVFVAGYLDGFTHEWGNASYGYTFDEQPVVLAQPQSFNGPHEIVARQRNITTSSVDWRVQEEEGRDGKHQGERVGGIIMEPGARSLYGVNFEIGRTANTVTHNWHQIEFDQTYDTPRFIAAMQTFDGPHTAGLRYRNLTSTGVEVFVEEEQSADDEMRHQSEVVGYMVVEAGVEPFDDGSAGLILGTTTSGSEGLAYTGDVTVQ